jgi:hypothetical protein
MEWIALVIIFLLSMRMFYVLGERMDAQEKKMVEVTSALQEYLMGAQEVANEDRARIIDLEAEAKALRKQMAEGFSLWTENCLNLEERVDKIQQRRE